uniref:Uncharacterized protein n=1 Tax=Anguilla anguilla TaxID=7936 RepID=A0A0E9PCS0_ANGAN
MGVGESRRVRKLVCKRERGSERQHALTANSLSVFISHEDIGFSSHSVVWLLEQDLDAETAISVNFMY